MKYIRILLCIATIFIFCSCTHYAKGNYELKNTNPTEHIFYSEYSPAKTYRLMKQQLAKKYDRHYSAAFQVMGEYFVDNESATIELGENSGVGKMILAVFEISKNKSGSEVRCYSLKNSHNDFLCFGAKTVNSKIENICSD